MENTTSFIGTDHIFCAMVFETLGGLNVEGEEVLRMIFRFAAKRFRREFTGERNFHLFCLGGTKTQAATKNNPLSVRKQEKSVSHV